MTATVWVALVTGVLGFVIGVLNFFVSRAQLKHQQEQFKAQLKHQQEQLKHQQEQFEAQLAQSRERMLLDHPDIGRIHNPDLAAIQTIRGLLQDKNHPKGRTFATIRHHLPGRTDDEIRSLIRSMGAIRQNSATEIWRLPNTGQ
jgi:hypothetical protein